MNILHTKPKFQDKLEENSYLSSRTQNTALTSDSDWPAVITDRREEGLTVRAVWPVSPLVLAPAPRRGPGGHWRPFLPLVT